MREIGKAELILNPDGSVYHLHLRPGEVAGTVIVVGDVGRVKRISRHFEKLEVEVQNRDFLSNTGWYKGLRLTVLSTGIGTDNIDIVINELDALVNIDLQERKPRPELKKLNIIRLGTSGGLQPGLPVDAFVASSYGLGFDGLIHFYRGGEDIIEKEMSEAVRRHLSWPANLPDPYIVKGSQTLLDKIGKGMVCGITATAPGFYGPQGRSLRMKPFSADFVDALSEFDWKGIRIVNFEMETSALFGLCRLLGHEALSVCVAVANRPDDLFSVNYQDAVDNLILLLLDRLVGETV